MEKSRLRTANPRARTRSAEATGGTWAHREPRPRTRSAEATGGTWAMLLVGLPRSIEARCTPRSGDALDCRRQSGAEERGFAESDGALRDAMARGTQELRCSCRPVWPVDRPCARPKATPWHLLDMDSSVSPTHGEQEPGPATIAPSCFLCPSKTHGAPAHGVIPPDRHLDLVGIDPKAVNDNDEGSPAYILSMLANIKQQRPALPF